MNPSKIDTILIVYSLSLNAHTFTAKCLEKIREAAPGTEVIVVRDEDEWKRKSAAVSQRVNVVFGRLPVAWFGDMPNLRWVQLTAAGVDQLLKSAEISDSDLIVTNARGIAAIPISEHILALMLTLSRDIGRSVRRQMKHEWDRRVRLIELNGSTMGLIGVGHIGGKTAEKAKCMNMKVLGLRRDPERSVSHVDKMYGRDGLEELLSQSDWVVITAAMTSETTGMIGEKELKAMKKSAYIINIARGPIIQGKALIKALEEGWIAGAGLDVFEEEPLPKDSPLWDMDNVIITPHHAGASTRHLNRVVELFAENLRRYQAGNDLINVVDKRMAY